MSSPPPAQTGVSYGALIVISLLVPPVAVYLTSGCHSELGFNILLTALFHLPGIIHAIYVVQKYEDKRKANHYQQPPQQNYQQPPPQQDYHQPPPQHTSYQDHYDEKPDYHHVN
ncbi:hypothetical protein DFJ63DRAFT_143491 [Scheffersomyces coipomensis]|uniref:uncharacterized protein n=1 Tax=Scheffersomyces coipomensis TaxID=1788519 RepID=UPI00315C8325